MSIRTTADPIFEPLTINGLTLKNRVVRSSLGGRVDYYDGSMSDARLCSISTSGWSSLAESTCAMTRRCSVMRSPRSAHSASRSIVCCKPGSALVNAPGT